MSTIIWDKAGFDGLIPIINCVTSIALMVLGLLWAFGSACGD